MRARLLLCGVLSLFACSKKPLRKIDVHTHFGPEAAQHMASLMDDQHLDVVVNLSGGWPGQGLEQALAVAKQSQGHMVVFCDPPLHRAKLGGDWAASLPAELERAKALGAKGVKIFKALGLNVVDDQGALVPVDTPALDAFFDKAGELGMPVAIHTGDPVAFWLAPTKDNERFDELSVHPGWSYFGRPVPSWEALFTSYERLVAKHPKTTFIGVHFGNAPEDPKRVAAMLAKYSNLYVDTAARVPELGRHERMPGLRELFITWQDRILFGTDLGVGPKEADLMLGSRGANAPTRDDTARFFRSTWRFFETSDRGFKSPTPIQGRWTIDGLDLPDEVLRKIYAGNAEKLLGLRAGAAGVMPSP